MPTITTVSSWSPAYWCPSAGPCRVTACPCLSPRDATLWNHLHFRNSLKHRCGHSLPTDLVWNSGVIYSFVIPWGARSRGRECPHLCFRPVLKCRWFQRMASLKDKYGQADLMGLRQGASVCWWSQTHSSDRWHMVFLPWRGECGWTQGVLYLDLFE